MNEVREALLLERFGERAAALPDERRRQARPLLASARKHHVAAEALIASGSDEDAARAFDAALADTLAAFDALSLDDPGLASRVAVARAVGSSEQAVDRGRFLVDARDAHQALHEALAPWVLEPGALRRARIRRAIALVVYGVVAVIGLVWWARRPPRLEAEASAAYSAQFAAAKAVDGDPKTEWLLPDRTTGAIDVRLVPGRSAHKLRVLDARNLPYADRSTENFQIELFDGDDSRGKIDGKFDAFRAEETWREFPLPGVRIDRIHIEVKSWHQSGAGFAEIVVE